MFLDPCSNLDWIESDRAVPAVMWELAAGGQLVDPLDQCIDGLGDDRGANQMGQAGRLLFIQMHSP